MNRRDNRRRCLCLHRPTARQPRRPISFHGPFFARVCQYKPWNPTSSHRSLHADEGAQNLQRKNKRRTVRNRTLAVRATQACTETAVTETASAGTLVTLQGPALGFDRGGQSENVARFGGDGYAATGEGSNERNKDCDAGDAAGNVAGADTRTGDGIRICGQN